MPRIQRLAVMLLNQGSERGLECSGRTSNVARQIHAAQGSALGEAQQNRCDPVRGNGKETKARPNGNDQCLADRWVRKDIAADHAVQVDRHIG